MIYLFLFIILCILESMYCGLMGSLYRKKKQDTGANDILDKPEQKNYRESKLIKLKNSMLGFANDFTFLFLKLVGYIPSHFIRNIFYRYIFHMRIGKKVVIYYGLESRCPWKISIDDGSIIGDHAIIDARFGVHIGKNVNLSTGVWIWTLQHDVNSPSFGVENQGKSVFLDNRCWISSGTIVLPGSIIGEGTVIAAGAVVTGKKYEAYTIYGGVPAKELGKRNVALDYQFEGQHRKFL